MPSIFPLQRIPISHYDQSMQNGITQTSPKPDYGSYDVILVNTSAGKDSEVMLDVVFAECKALGIESRMVAVHCDLGRVEWTGTKELARRQAERYGIRFEVVERAQDDLLEHVEKRGMWPGMGPTRYCTSDHKTKPVHKLMTALVAELNTAGGYNPRSNNVPQRRILNCLGMRAQESREREKLQPFCYDTAASNGKRHVDRFLPVFTMREDAVWAHIRREGLEYHPAYDLGMRRLSCCFCIYAEWDDLLIAGHANPELLAEYVAVEQRINHTFKPDLALIQIQRAVAAGERPAGTATGHMR